MDNAHVPEEKVAITADVPAAPAWRWSGNDLVLVAGVPLTLYVGGLGAGAGSVWGFVIACFGALAMVTLVAQRRGRRNQPRVATWVPLASVGAAAVVVVLAWGLWRGEALEGAALVLAPLVLVAVALGTVAALRWAR
ncbi:hypothetical protein [Litorihabitans aurantiacus]|uniref:Uncharacterized protein n=1 Tax=Litorihabitans aurantiacus TaxID=1930061 RepID=A0AA37UG78_9MICO|nr:hypothetical protein [Litorihabitans aurantiacus]GMA30108.1 hypothetical protein GCM10025875_01000 [Litorihabitans aurantiacus]